MAPLSLIPDIHILDTDSHTSCRQRLDTKPRIASSWVNVQTWGLFRDQPSTRWEALLDRTCGIPHEAFCEIIGKPKNTKCNRYFGLLNQPFTLFFWIELTRLNGSKYYKRSLKHPHRTHKETCKLQAHSDHPASPSESNPASVAWSSWYPIPLHMSSTYGKFPHPS